MNSKTLRFVLPVIAAGVLMAGCSGNDRSAVPTLSASAAATHNQADVTFAQQMIPHHQQAVEMAKMVPAATTDQQVRDLAAGIRQAQDPEIQQLNGWLKSWGGPQAGMNHEGMDHGSMTGMMSTAEMTELGKAQGAEFDRQWLEMMVEHHQGAIEMAKTELQQGGSAEVKQLAQQIVDGQQKEITTMNGLLGRS